MEFGDSGSKYFTVLTVSSHPFLSFVLVLKCKIKLGSPKQTPNVHKFDPNALIIPTPGLKFRIKVTHLT